MLLFFFLALELRVFVFFKKTKKKKTYIPPSPRKPYLATLIMLIASFLMVMIDFLFSLFTFFLLVKMVPMSSCRLVSNVFNEIYSDAMRWEYCIKFSLPKYMYLLSTYFVTEGLHDLYDLP